MKTNNNGIGVLGLLGVSFIVLKLTGYINWSWWFVTMPFWGGLALFIIAVILIFIVLAIKENIFKNS